ncbi:hypothetical protein BCV70DRAFT_209495 [Testicularia cyperi]|uniref:Glyoxalase/fosfomycin resistance/dioxygenase domain-containing protein n=1 Tax=Testicularia cyperi TaxID=1882483 RepID=A0A317XXR1_9BASI|nr:hypothetical protein BCV70DRAFT_209495 [Testicularia cyperi]
MDDEDISMPPTPTDLSPDAIDNAKDVPGAPETALCSAPISAGTDDQSCTEAPVNEPHKSLFMSLSGSARPRLILSPEDKANFAAHIQDSKKRFASDTAYLPKSTNMGLSDADAAALLSVNPFNFSRGRPNNWEDDDVDVDRSRIRNTSRAGKTAFMNAFPCLFVTNMTTSVDFYQKILGFSPVGKPATHQAVMRRGPAARPPRGSGQPYSAIPPAAEEAGVRVVLRYLPAEWGELKSDGTGPPQLLIVVSNVDELFNEIVAKQQQFRPSGAEYFPEVFLGKAKVLSKPQNKPWGTRELHILDPDANKIIFYHEL